jgi:hypothetical protein
MAILADCPEMMRLYIVDTYCASASDTWFVMMIKFISSPSKSALYRGFAAIAFMSIVSVFAFVATRILCVHIDCAINDGCLFNST